MNCYHEHLMSSDMIYMYMYTMQVQYGWTYNWLFGIKRHLCLHTSQIKFQHNLTMTRTKPSLDEGFDNKTFVLGSFVYTFILNAIAILLCKKWFE